MTLDLALSVAGVLAAIVAQTIYLARWATRIEESVKHNSLELVRHDRRLEDHEKRLREADI